MFKTFYNFLLFIVRRQLNANTLTFYSYCFISNPIDCSTEPKENCPLYCGANILLRLLTCLAIIVKIVVERFKIHFDLHT